MIAGLATATMVASTRIMKNPTNSAHSAGQGLAGSARVNRDRGITNSTGGGSSGVGATGTVAPDGTGAPHRRQVRGGCRSSALQDVRRRRRVLATRHDLVGPGHHE